jgi:polyphosphate glucokinase
VNALVKQGAAPARTLCIDIGGTGLKAMIVSAKGKPLTERARVETPRPATPRAVSAALQKIIPPRTEFDRISVGFPGVIIDGVVKTAHNLHPSWEGYDLATAILRATGRPTRVLNDAGVQGHGSIQGRGVEVCITLGTGLGFSIFVNGHYVPNVELGHHPFRKDKTYEDELGARGLRHLGKKKWNKVLGQAIDQIQQTFNCRVLYIGGGNAKKITLTLPKNARVVENVAGLLGGVKLWERD